MNNRIIFLAEAIQNKIQQLQSSTFSAIDRDILLEDVREIYRLIQEAEIKSSSTSSSDSLKVETNFVPQQENVVIEKTPESEVKSVTEPIANATTTIEETAKENSLEELVANLQKELEEAKKSEQTAFQANHNTTQEQVATPQTEVFIEHEVEAQTEENFQPDFLNTNIEEEKVEVLGSSLNDSFSSNNIASLNQRVVAEPVKELHNLISSGSPFSSIIDFNNRILFTQELFNGDSQMCTTFLAQIENCKTLDDAKTIVNTHALTKGWKGDNDAVKSLVKLVRQFYS